MSGTAISLDDAGFQDVLRRLVARTGDLTPAMRDIGQGLVLSTQHRFETETDPTGRPWRPLSAVTLLRRIASRVTRKVDGETKRFRTAFDRKGNLTGRAQKNLANLKILQVQGHLKNSIHRVAGRDQVEVGSNLVYARIHQFGGQAGRGRKVTIPPRPFLGIDDGDRTMILDILRRHVGGVA